MYNISALTLIFGSLLATAWAFLRGALTRGLLGGSSGLVIVVASNGSGSSLLLTACLLGSCGNGAVRVAGRELALDLGPGVAGGAMVGHACEAGELLVVNLSMLISKL
jgi:hypothetical protein